MKAEAMRLSNMASKQFAQTISNSAAKNFSKDHTLQFDLTFDSMEAAIKIVLITKQRFHQMSHEFRDLHIKQKELILVVHWDKSPDLNLKML